MEDKLLYPDDHLIWCSKLDSGPRTARIDQLADSNEPVKIGPQFMQQYQRGSILSDAFIADSHYYCFTDLDEIKTLTERSVSPLIPSAIDWPQPPLPGQPVFHWLVS